jgi:hypothetical protein
MRLSRVMGTSDPKVAAILKRVAELTAKSEALRITAQRIAQRSEAAFSRVRNLISIPTDYATDASSPDFRTDTSLNHAR